MLGGVTRHVLPHLPGIPHLHVNRPLVGAIQRQRNVQKKCAARAKFVFFLLFRLIIFFCRSCCRRGSALHDFIFCLRRKLRF